MNTFAPRHDSEGSRLKTLRRSTFAATAGGFLLVLVCAGLAACGPTAPADAAGTALDTSRLPRVAGAKELYANAFSTLYTTPMPVAETAGVIKTSLTAGGWQTYVAPFTDYAKSPDFQILSLKKGPQALQVSVSRAPAQGTATSVSYTAIVLAGDLPFPADATDIAFSPERPYLSCATAKPVAETRDFFTKELAAMGWSLWPGLAIQAAKRSDNAAAPTAAHAYFVRDQRQPLHLVLHRGDDGTSKVELEAVPPEMLTAELTPDAPQKAPEMHVHAQKPADPMDDMIENAMQQMTKAILKATGEAVAHAVKPTARPKAVGAGETLRARPDAEVPIPLPETASNVEFDGAAGSLEFDSSSSVGALASFYRAAMKPQGWKEKRSVINQENMVVLNFKKGRKDLSMTIMQMGDHATADADGSGLVTQAKSETADASQTADAEPTMPAMPKMPEMPAMPAIEDAADTSAEPASQELIAEDMDGFPIPEAHSSTHSGETKFRTERETTVPAPLASVLAFYRRELAKGDWKEAKGAIVTPDRAQLTFASSGGNGVLTLTRTDGETAVSFVEKREAEAKKVGILPKAGQAKLIMGSMAEVAAEVTINKRTIKVTPGMGGDRPDGPSLDLPPGTYAYSVKVAGAPAANEEVAVGADETWALVIGPGGGSMPLHMY
jgi:hypothetical protein